MARRTNYGFNKRQREKAKQEKQERKRQLKEERKEAEENGETTPSEYGDDPTIAPIDPADLGLSE